MKSYSFEIGSHKQCSFRVVSVNNKIISVEVYKVDYTIACLESSKTEIFINNVHSRLFRYTIKLFRLRYSGLIAQKFVLESLKTDVS